MLEQLQFWWGNLIRIKISTEELLFKSSYFCNAKTFSEQILFNKGTSSKKYFLRTDTFQQRYFFKRNTFSEQLTFWKKLIFQKTDIRITHYVLFLERHFVRVATLSKDLIFHNSYFFRRATFHNYTFSEEILFHEHVVSN